MTVYINTHNADSRRKSDPAELPPDSRVVADHLLDTIVEAVHTKRPGYGDALEEDQEQQTEAGDSIRVEDLEDVHTTLEYGEGIVEFHDAITFKSNSMSR